nr:aquaporin [Rhodococcus opacus PD630]
MSTASPLPHRQPLARAADEFALTTVLLFLAVTVVRWLRDPGSALYIADLDVALAVIGVLSGIILTGLMFSPPGRRAGGHMNPAVTLALWLMNGFPGRSVPPYILAQLGVQRWGRCSGAWCGGVRSRSLLSTTPRSGPRPPGGPPLSFSPRWARSWS